MYEINAYDASGEQINCLVQWDKDVKVYIEDPGITAAHNVHFINSRSDLALVVESSYSGGKLSAQVPNTLLAQPYPITGYIYITDSTGTRSLYVFHIAMKARPEPNDYIYEDTDGYKSIEEIIEECRKYANQSASSATTASEYASDAASSAASASSSASDAAASAERAEQAANDANIEYTEVKEEIREVREIAEGAQSDVDDVKAEIEDARKVTDSDVYDSLGDAIRGVLSLSEAYTDNRFNDYKPYTIEIVDELPSTGEEYTFYLVPNASGTGYDKYWWITDDDGNSKWDVFGSASTLVVDELPDVGDVDTDYILKTDTGYVFYKYINGGWYLIGGDSYTKAEMDEKLAEIETRSDTLARQISDLNDWCLTNTGVQLDYDETTGDLYLLNTDGVQLGDAIHIAVTGIDGLTLDTILDEDEDGNPIYYLVLYDEDGKEITRCLLPATGGGGTAYLVRLINLMDSLRYSVTYGEEHKIGVLYMETIGTESTGLDGSLEVFYKPSTADDDDYVSAGVYTIPCASSSSDTSSALYIDVTDLLTAGETTNIKFVVTGGESMQTKTLIYTITAVEISMTTTTSFDSVFTGNFSFLYRTLGRGISKTVYFYIDDELYAEVDVGTSHNVQLSQAIELVGHYSYGAHDFKAYFITSDGSQSNVLHYIIMYDDGSSSEPIISALPVSDEVIYGEALGIEYITYTPNSESTASLNIRLYSIDESGVETVWASSSLANVVDETVHTWTSDSYPESGTVYVELTSGNTVVVVPITIVENGLGVDISTVTTNLVYSMSTSGRSNDDVDRDDFGYEYTDVNGTTTNIRCTLENMNWVSDGFVSTDYGTALRLAGDDKMTINLPIFSSSYTDEEGQSITFNGTPTGIGRTIEITLNAHEVTDNTVDVVSCMSSGHAGFKITPQTAYLLTSTGTNIVTDDTGFIENEESICAAYIKDDKKLRLTFVVSAAASDNKQCLNIYINGEVANSQPYDSGENIVQSLPITIGNSACVTDIYDVKIYDRELTEDEIQMNYYASQSTIAERVDVYEDNDILDDNEKISYDKAIYKYPCLLCEGTLSAYKGQKTKVGWKLTKPDGEGGYTVEFDCCEKDADGNYLGQSNVQGTTSAKFIRKNYKVYPVYFDTDGVTTKKFKYDMKTGGNGIGASTLCWKADYMSTDHANTYNANIAEEILTEEAPSAAQLADPRIQNCVNGFRCLLFNDEGHGDGIVFAGDGCLNNDKSDFECWGYVNDGDLPKDSDGNIISNYTKVQRYEFLTNSSDICYFKKDNLQHYSGNSDTPDVYEAFESMYPDQDDLMDAGLEPNWDYIQVLCTWLAQRANYWDADKTTRISETYNGVTYTNEYDWRRAIFENEFEKHLNMDRTLIYYLFVEFVALADNRAKNVFMTCWDTTVEKLLDTSGNEITIDQCIDSDGNVDADKIDWLNSTFCVWEPTLYDLDSCYSAENNGYLRIPYYADWDYELNGVKQFNGYDSRLWLPFEDVFADRIKQMAQTLAVDDLMCYDKFYDAHIVNGSEKMCCSVVNKDMIYKYQDPWTEGYYDYSESTTNPVWTMTNMYKYLHRGQRTEQKQAYIYNRAHMWYSKYQTDQFTNNAITFRAGDDVAMADTKLTLSASIALFLGCRFGDASITTNGKVMPNEYTTLQSSTGLGGTDTIYIYSGSDITDIGDVSAFRPFEVQLMNARKLKKLIIGNENITNGRLSSLDTSNCGLLQVLNIRGCTVLAGTLDLDSNGLLEEVYAANSGVTYFHFPTGGNLKILELPAISSLVILNHPLLEEFTCESYENLSSLRIENTPNVPSDEILSGHLSQLTSGIRLVGVEWHLDDTSLLELLISDEAKGKYINANGVWQEDPDAYPYISGDVYITRINENLYNKVKEIYPYLNIHYDLFTHTVNFYSDDDVLYATQEIDNGGDAIRPAISPTKPSTIQYFYIFVDWDTSFTNVVRDLNVYALYSASLQKYDVSFYETTSSSSPLYSVSSVEYGSSAEYVGENPSSGTQIRMYSGYAVS